MTYLDNLTFDDFEQLVSKGLRMRDSIPAIREHFELTPVFAFDYMSTRGSKYCFDYCELEVIDYLKLLERCREISQYSLGTLALASGRLLHFHEVSHSNLENLGLISYFKENIGPDFDDASVPQFFQFEVHTDKKNSVAPRAIGFIGKMAVFYLIWLDLYHEVYPDPKHQPKGK